MIGLLVPLPLPPVSPEITAPHRPGLLSHLVVAAFSFSLQGALVNLLSAITSPEKQRRPLSVVAGRMVRNGVPEWGNACPGLCLGSPWLRLKSVFTVERKGLPACVCKFSPSLSGNDTGALRRGCIRMAFECLNAIHMGKTAGSHVCAYKRDCGDARNMQKIQSGPLSLGGDTSVELRSVFRG